MKRTQTITISWPPGIKELALGRIAQLSPDEAHRALSGYLAALVITDCRKDVLFAPIKLAMCRWDELPKLPDSQSHIADCKGSEVAA